MVADADRNGSGASGIFDRDNAKFCRRTVHLYTFLKWSFVVRHKDSNAMMGSGTR